MAKYKFYDIDTKRPVEKIGKEKMGYQKVKYSDGEEYKIKSENIKEYSSQRKKLMG